MPGPHPPYLPDAPDPGQPPGDPTTGDPTTDALAAYQDMDKFALLGMTGAPGTHPTGKAATGCCRSAAMPPVLHVDHMGNVAYVGDHPRVLRISLDDGARLPVRQHADDAGLDLWPVAETLPRLMPHETRTYNTGVRVEIPAGYVGILATRSSMAKRSVEVGGGIIDSGFRGAIGVALTNHGQAQWVAGPGAAIAQLILVPIATPAVMVVESLGATDRGEKGFGSSDRKGGA